MKLIESDWPVINVAGQRFQLDLRKIRARSESIFSHEDFEDMWDDTRMEYFIDRHRATFEVMANWFMKGKCFTQIVKLQNVKYVTVCRLIGVD